MSVTGIDETTVLGVDRLGRADSAPHAPGTAPVGGRGAGACGHPDEGVRATLRAAPGALVDLGAGLCGASESGANLGAVRGVLVAERTARAATAAAHTSRRTNTGT